MIRRILALALFAPCLAQAKAQFDRTRPPALPVAPKMVLPTVTIARLVNGIALRVVPQHEMPLVQVTMTVGGGSRLDGSEPGLASFTARMLTESAGGKDANTLQS